MLPKGSMSVIMFLVPSLGCALITIRIVQSSDPETFHEENDADEFIPTNDWQKVKPGQHIPAGLHVRMDLEKGGRWAKLMDKDSGENAPAEVAIPVKVEDKSETARTINVDELTSVLKGVIDEKKEKLKEEAPNEKLRSMDEIKAAFDELHLQQETDFKVMQRLLKKYSHDIISVEERIIVLKDLEIYVHQVDNAIDFIKLNGLQHMVTALNSTESEIRSEAAHVIGSAVQSNPAVQVKAVESGALTSLVRMISNTNERVDARKKALYAISCLIRHFPAAQYMFRNIGGFSALASCVHEHRLGKLRFKIISLIHDLIVERKEQFSVENPNQDDEERERQYKLFSISDEIRQLGICKAITALLETSEHDQREILVSIVGNVHNICRDRPGYLTQLRSALRQYENEYKTLADSEKLEGDSDSYFHLMHANVVDLVRLVGPGLRTDHTEL